MALRSSDRKEYVIPYPQPVAEMVDTNVIISPLKDGVTFLLSYRGEKGLPMMPIDKPTTMLSF